MKGIDWINVSKRFGSATVIPDFNLSILPGEFVALLGPSGCGKSTLLRMLAGLEPVSGGRIEIGGRDVTNLPPGQRGIAMVFQQYALYPQMTVGENMAFGLRNIGLPAVEITRRVDAAAEMLELGSLMARRPTQLSGGQRQRVAIGRAVVKEPDAFLFDEPLSNLDAELRTRTRVQLARLHKRLQTTMLFVTHDQVEAMTLADRIVVMNKGRIEQLATPMELYDRPASRFVAGFVGNHGMNFIEVTRTLDQQRRIGVRLPGGRLLVTEVAASPELGEVSTLGIRADALSLVGDGNSECDLHGVVEVIERLGDRTLLHVQLTDGSLVIADATRQAEPALNEAVQLKADMTRAHLFNAAGLAMRCT